jgi:hypothetical protein
MRTGRVALAITMAAALSAVVGYRASAQDAQTQDAQAPDAQSPEAQAKDAQVREVKGIPARASATDYQAHAVAGNVTVAADFTGHSVATPEAVFSTEDYVAIEVALFGPPEARLKLSHDDFSLRIIAIGRTPLERRAKAKKATAMPAQPYGLVLKSLKDPSWEPPTPASKGSKTSIGGGGGGGNDPPPATPHMPFDLVRAMQQKVQKASLPEGDRALPGAGLIFFDYHGKTEGRTIELIYSGPAGKATLTLQQ